MRWSLNFLPCAFLTPVTPPQVRVGTTVPGWGDVDRGNGAEAGATSGGEAGGEPAARVRSGTGCYSLLAPVLGLAMAP